MCFETLIHSQYTTSFDLYMHFHHVLSRVSDLPQFSLSAFKPQLLDRQKNDYISNAKKKIYIEPRNFGNILGSKEFVQQR